MKLKIILIIIIMLEAHSMFAKMSNDEKKKTMEKAQKDPDALKLKIHKGTESFRNNWTNAIDIDSKDNILFTSIKVTHSINEKGENIPHKLFVSFKIKPTGWRENFTAKINKADTISIEYGDPIFPLEPEKTIQGMNLQKKMICGGDTQYTIEFLCPQDAQPLYYIVTITSGKATIKKTFDMKKECIIQENELNY